MSETADAGGRMLAIAIAVAGSVPSKYLPGAINGARNLEAWARAQGYETLLVTDEGGPVTMASLRAAIEGLLTKSPEPIHRILVYFAGHGLIRELEEGLWLLSDWRSELRAVAVEVLRRRLSMYHPKQVTIISDACRSLPADVTQADLVADPVLGSGPKPTDPTVAIDKFVAAQDGAVAFMIPGPDPGEDRCLFSGVLVEGLWGLSGLKGSPFSKADPDQITSRSLAAYLQAEVPARAGSYDLTLVPIVSPTFPEGDDCYFAKAEGRVPPAFPDWPPKAKVANLSAVETPERPAPSLASKLWDLRAATSFLPLAQFSGGFGKPAAPRPPPPPPAPPPSISDQLRDQVLPGPGSGVSSGFAVSGGVVRRLWAADGVALNRGEKGQWWTVDQPGPMVRQAPVMIEFADGRCTPVVAYPNLFLSVVRDEYGANGMVYRSPYGPREDSAPTEAALAALESGALRADAAADLAVQLRLYKHTDPVLGVISAYLYDAVGDVESNRRMAGFYVQSDQAIPFDIALLAGLRGHRTPEGFVAEIPEVKEREPQTDAEREQYWTYCGMQPTRGLVGGLWPWMRQGWVLLDDPGDLGSPLILDGLADLRAHMMRSRFATFEPDAAQALANIGQLSARPE